MRKYNKDDEKYLNEINLKLILQLTEIKINLSLNKIPENQNLNILNQ